ncbi:MAG TPA: fatty acid desaturase [Gemmataceae bacterium]|nr:fatty acid desaturase [Gemmataceae bacterium]
MRNAKHARELMRSTKPFAREVAWRSWWHFWSTLAVLASLLAITCFDIFWVLRLGVSILAGLTMVRMFIVFHDHQHGTILRGSTLADIILWMIGMLLLTPRSVWRHSHDYHHHRNARIQATGIGTFPLMTTQAFAQASWWRRLAYAVSRHPLTILAGYLTIFIFGMCIYPLLLRPRKHLDSALALVIHVALVTALAIFAPGVLLWTLMVPLGLATALGSYLFYAQHNFPDAHFQDATSFDFFTAALTASSYIPMNPVMRWFTGNIGYHHVHHLNARIPFYRLPEAMAQLKILQSPGKTSLGPIGIYRCLRLKLWDADKQRLVNFAGV